MRDLVVDEPVAGDEAVAMFPGQDLGDERPPGAFDDQPAGRTTCCYGPAKREAEPNLGNGRPSDESVAFHAIK